MINDNQDAAPLNPADQMLAEAERLIWALLDDSLDEAEATQLTALMEENAAVRARYVECVQLHVDLSSHFAPRAAGPGPASGTPVLPNLLPDGMTGVESFPRVTD
jgi:anti-sigma factor RsiW